MCKSVLYLNNYANTVKFFETFNPTHYPRHHLWGADLLADNFKLIIPRWGFHIKTKNKLIRIVYCMIYQAYLYIMHHDVDMVYASCSHITDLFSLLKIVGLYRGKVIFINHHHRKIYFINGVDRIITISNDVLNYLKATYPDKTSKFINIQWGGDTEFYNRNKNDAGKKYTFIQNGKTNRDISLVLEALQNSNESAVLYLSGTDIPTRPPNTRK